MQMTTRVLAEIERLVPIFAGTRVSVLSGEAVLTQDGARQVLRKFFEIVDDHPVVTAADHKEPVGGPAIPPYYGRNY